MPLKLITLDLDDTLWAIEPVLAGAEDALRAWLAEHAPAALPSCSRDHLQILRQQTLARFPHWAHDVSRIRQRMLEQLLLDCGYPGSLAADAYACFLDARHRVTPYGEVMDALQALAQRFRLAAVTNGNADVTRLPMGRFFTASINPARAGCAKPDPRIFRQLLDELRLTPQEAIHVGDSPLHDVVGARGAGMNAVWMNRDALAWTLDGEPPPRTVRDLRELESVLAQPPWSG